MVGVPVGPGEEDLEDLCRDLLQLVRINSFPDRIGDTREIRKTFVGVGVHEIAFALRLALHRQQGI